jgi:hypothetical protein
MDTRSGTGTGTGTWYIAYGVNTGSR